MHVSGVPTYSQRADCARQLAGPLSGIRQFRVDLLGIPSFEGQKIANRSFLHPQAGNASSLPASEGDFYTA
jgi:hypothetical protein